MPVEFSVVISRYKYREGFLGRKSDIYCKIAVTPKEPEYRPSGCVAPMFKVAPMGTSRTGTVCVVMPPVMEPASILKLLTAMFEVPFVMLKLVPLMLNWIGRKGKLCVTIHLALEIGPLAVTQLEVLVLFVRTVTVPGAPHVMICPNTRGLGQLRLWA